MCRSRYPETTSGTTHLCSSIRVIIALLMPFVLDGVQSQFYRWRAANTPVSDMRLAGAIRADRTLILPETVFANLICTLDTPEHNA